MRRCPIEEQELNSCNWILYSTSACHLCEQAAALLTAVLGDRDVVWQEIDIAEHESLLERYGVRIPVIQHRLSGQELGWPFDAPRLQHWQVEVEAAS